MLNSGRRGKRAPDGYGIISVNENFNQQNYPVPIINSYAVTDGSYNPLDDLALSTAGGQTVVIYGSGFRSGVVVNINGTNLTTTLLDQGRLAITSPALSSGTYTIYASNSNGATAMYVPGLIYSGTPTWSTGVNLGSGYETKSYSQNLVATSDSTVTYSLAPGSNLPSGVTLTSGGSLSGTLPVDSGSTTYTFTIIATDAELQDTSRQFSLTVNTDVVTWLTPSANYVISSYEYAPISNVTASATSAAGYGVLYSANTLPAGISLNTSSGLIYGTNNTVGNTNTRLTATANTTNRSATRDVVFNVNPDVVTWTNPATDTSYTLNQGAAITNLTLAATSAAGFGVQYAANALPDGVTLSGGTISGTPSSTGTTYTALTATANTTNRSAVRYITWTVSIASDTYFASTTMLLSANSTLQTSSFVEDNSINNAQLTVVGDTREQNFNPYQPGYYSYQFNGSSDYLTVPTNTAYNFAAGDFTIEAWVYNNNMTTYSVICGVWTGTAATSSWVVTVGSADNTKLRFGYSSGSATTFVESSAGAVPLYKWTHIQISRTGGYLMMYANGVVVYYASFSTTLASPSTVLSIGAAGAANFANMFISNLRIIKGYSLNQATLPAGTSVFTPSNIPLASIDGTSLLTAQSNRFFDNSPLNAAFTITSAPKVSSFNPFTSQYVALPYYSTYFNNSTDYLSVPNNTVFDFGTGDYTVEAWVYISAYNGTTYEPVFANGFLFYVGSTGQLLIYNGSADVYTGTAGDVPTGQWVHVAWTRAGGTTRAFSNGVLKGSTTGATSQAAIGSGSPNKIGNYSTVYFPGYISNLRVTKGQALYTSTFTPSTTPLTVVANTSLLTCQSNTFIDNSTNNFAITPATTTVKTTTLTPFAKTYYSGFFAGAVDYLTLPSGSLDYVHKGATTYTIEGWFNTSASVAVYILSTAIGTTATDIGFSIGLSNGGTNNLTLTVCRGTLQFNYSTPNNVWNTSVWNHFAITFNSTNGTYAAYINGVQQTFTLTSGTVAYSSSAAAYAPAIGRYQYSTPAGYFSGNISNLRVTKELLYTGNFTPSTTPLTITSQGISSSANVTVLTCQDSTFKDNSPNAYTVTVGGSAKPMGFAPFSPTYTGYTNTPLPTTYGSGYFDGTGDNLTVPSNPSLAFGSSNFTIEFWVYSGTNGSTTRFMGNINGVSWTTNRWAMGLNNGSNKFFFTTYNYSSSVNMLVSTTSFNDNTWKHVAVVRSGNVWTLYVNGVSEATVTSATSMDGGVAQPWTIANSGYTTDPPTTGYISDLRVNNSAIYTTNFVPQFTGSLSATANTQLLTLQTNGAHNNSTFGDNSSLNNLVNRNGNVTNGTFSPYGDNWSNYTNGNAGWAYVSAAQMTSSNLANFGTGNFTIECWVNPVTVGTGTGGLTLFHIWDGNANNGRFGFSLIPSGSAGLDNYNGMAISAGTLINAVTITPGVWYHVAITRNGNNLDVWINGIRHYNYTSSATFTPYTYQLSIGGYISNYTTGTGYISNFRIVKGTAVYTSTFTPPTSPLTAIPGTTLLTLQSPIMVDKSPSAVTVLAGGSTVQKFSPFSSVTVPKYYSYFFNGSTDYITLPAGSADFLHKVAAPWTIECWFYANSVAVSKTLFSTSAGSNSIGVTLFVADTSSGDVGFTITKGTAGTYYKRTYTAGNIVTVNTWNHIAVTHTSGGTLTIYVNGVSIPYTTIGAGTGASSSTATYVPAIGRYQDATPAGYFNGYISNLRVINGTALYSSNFTPSTSTLTAISNTAILTCQDNTFIDNSTNKFLLTAGTTTVKPVLLSPFTPTANTGLTYSPTTFGGSMYFDGTGDYLSVPYTYAHQVATGDFTVEAWVYRNAAGVEHNIALTRSSAGTDGWGFRVNSTNTVSFFFTGGTTLSSTGTILAGQWYHIAFTKSGNTGRIFINGVLDGTTATMGTGTFNTQPLRIGVDNTNAAGYMNGYISDLRLTPGIALYTANFYPTSTPATQIAYSNNRTDLSNTGISALFVNGTSGGVIDATRTVDFETVGDAKVTTFSPYNGSYYSVLFNGSTDYFTTPGNTVFDMGTGDFTIECFVTTNGYSGSQYGRGIFALYPSGNYSKRLILRHTTVDNRLNLYGYDGTSTYFGSSGNDGVQALTPGLWYHIALVRQSGVFRLFINGIQDIVISNQTGITLATSNCFDIGRTQEGSVPNWNGNISNFRVTKGQALYTGNFTPATLPLTISSVGTSGANVASNLTGTVSLDTCQSKNFADNSTNAFTLTVNGTPKVATQNPFKVNDGQSYYFDGTGDYLNLKEDTALWNFGTGDFTIEAWVNPAARVTNGAYILARSQYGVNSDWLFNITSTGTLQFYMLTGGSNIVTSTGTVPLNSWTHVAVTRSGTTVKLYINGVNDGTLNSFSSALTTSYGPTVIGNSSNNTGSTYFNGYISDLRITKGVARYTSNNTSYLNNGSPYMTK